MIGVQMDRNLNYDQFADAGPSPTEPDALATIVHLADSAAFNHKHGAMHLARTQEEVAKLPDSLGKQRDLIIWHLDHATKHHIAAQEDLESLVHHAKTSQFLKPHTDEIGEATRRLQNW